MKHLTIVIATESQIIAAGVKALLTPNREIQFNPVDIHPSEIGVTMRRLLPSAIIVDASDGNALDELRRAKAADDGLGTIVIGLCHSVASPSTMQLFDATFSIYDRADALYSIVKRNITIDSHTLHAELTPREKEVIIGIVKGLSNKELAAEINVSVNTVMTHRRNIASKLRIHSPAGLTIYAIVSKLVSLDDIKGQIGSAPITD